MKLVTELADHPDFGRGSWAHQALMHRVALDVARLAGVPVEKRKIPWSSAVLAVVIGVPFAYWTWTLNDDGFRWYSIFSGAVAAFMLIALLGMLIPSQDDAPADDSEMVVHPLAGDINRQPD